MEWLVWGEENVRLFDTEEYFLKVMTRIPVFLDLVRATTTKSTISKIKWAKQFFSKYFFWPRENLGLSLHLTHCLKIALIVSFEFLNFGIFQQFLF